MASLPRSVFRLSNSKYANELSGKGAAKSNNRWNSKGTEIIYTSESRALAMAEVAVHLSLNQLPDDFLMLEIGLPKNVKIQELDTRKLMPNWNRFPYIAQTKQFGDQFIQENKSLILKVPSAIVPGDFNFLINPFHTDFKKLEILNKSSFPLDSRMLS